MKRIQPANDATVGLCIILIVSTSLALFSLSAHLVNRVSRWLSSYKDDPSTELVVNVIFLVLMALLWLAYRRWRQAEVTIAHLLHADELTGLCNRRSFFALAKASLEEARTADTRMSLVFVDLDGLKQINDAFGHAEGDAALIRAAKALKETFHTSDLIARLGGDEFTVLTADCPDDCAVLTDRLQARLDALNADRNDHYKLSATLGIAHSDADPEGSIDDLVRAADADMYARKKGRKGNPLPGDPADTNDNAIPHAEMGTEL